KSEDGSRFTAEQVVTGAFQTVGGTVKSVTPETNEIKIEVLGGKQQMTVVVNKDSMLRRIPPQVATFLAMRSQGKGGPGPAGPGQGAPGQAGGGQGQMGARGPGGDPAGGGAPARQGPPQSASGAASGAASVGGPGGPRMEAGGDFQDMLERMPALT